MVVQRHRMAGQAVLDDVDDGAAVDALADRSAQPLIGQNGAPRAVESEVVPHGRRGVPDDDSGRAFGGDHVVECADAGGVDRVVLQRGDDCGGIEN